jgi:hypothetical protein
MKFSEYPHNSKAGAKSRWIMKAPVISTAHITITDDKVLACQTCEYGLVMAILQPGYLLHISGYLLHISDLHDDADFPKGISAELKDLCLKFAAIGYDYLRLDPDGDILEDLPQFDW